jgi:hypothetical protein
MLIGRNVWRQRFERVIQQGITNIDVVYIIKEIFLPILILLLDHLVIPYFFGRLIGLVIGIQVEKYTIRTLICRYSFLTYIILKLFIWSMYKLYNILRKLHNEIRDSRYLLGTELTNR